MNRIAILCMVSALAAGPAAARQADWEDQLREMQYLMMHISAINAVNGMNLTREQASTLRGLAKRVEAAGAWVPEVEGEFEPRLAMVRQTYHELRDVLVKGEPVPKELEARVAKARVAEAAVIRESMAGAPKGSERTGQCTKCHVSPRAGAGRSPAQEAEADRRLHRLRHTNKMGTFFAHLNGLYNRGGSMALVRAAPQIDATLTEGQKDVIHKFSCCLIPPEDLSDPVRAGQADVPERTLKLIRFVRQTNPSAWPTVQAVLLKRMIEGRKARKPGLSAPEQQQARAHYAAVFEEARGMSDVDFEMKKEDLCRELNLDAPSEERPERTRRFMAAMFLLVPGMDQMYTEVARRQQAR